MAGQTPEPSYQPPGQDPGLTIGRPAWPAPPPSYPPPAGGGTGGGQAYAAPAPYAPQDQGYPQQDQTQTNLGHGGGPGQGPNQDYQDYQGYQPYQQAYQGYGAQQGQGTSAPPPQWQGGPAVKHAGTRAGAQGEKGFVGSLFDYSFTSLITPKVVKGLYIMATVMTAFGLLVIYGLGRTLAHGSVGTGLVVLVIFGIPYALLSLGVTRLILEAADILFKIHEELKAIRRQGESQG
jgi:hypothetical protein